MTVAQTSNFYYRYIKFDFWTHPIKMRMTPDSIVKYLEIIRNIRTGHFSRFIYSSF